MTLAELKARLDAATGPDRELDLDVAKWAGHWSKAGRVGSFPRFSYSIDAALALVAEKLPGWQMAVDISPKHGRACCRLREDIGAEPSEECAPTAPLAILRALVAAMEEQS